MMNWRAVVHKNQEISIFMKCNSVLSGIVMHSGEDYVSIQDRQDCSKWAIVPMEDIRFIRTIAFDVFLVERPAKVRDS